jgi:hypothetical protein
MVIGGWYRTFPGLDCSRDIIQRQFSACRALLAVSRCALGFTGASSPSGRRTAITNWARRISTNGGSLRDVQILAGHSALSTTQRYIEADAGAMRRIVQVD